MLKGDIGKLAEACGVSKTTIYRIAEKINLDLKPLRHRCDKTVDVFSGYTLTDEQKDWMKDAILDINAYRTVKRERKARQKAEDKPVQVEIM
jgi:transcriptional antiterminator